jgi:voltage-gated potassium channel
MMVLMAERSAERLEAYEEKYDGPMSLVALILVTVAVIQFTGTASDEATGWLEALAVILWVALAVDLVIRLFICPSPRKFVVKQPVYVAAVIIPPLRIFLVGRIVRFMDQRARKRLSDRATAYVAMVTLEVVVIGGVLVTAVERDAPGASILTLGDGLWWAIVTVATVGYGDVVPVTEAGRLIGVGVIVVAVVLLAVITANISSRFVSEQAKRDAEGTEDDGVLVRLERIESLLQAAAGDVKAAEGSERSPQGGERSGTAS